MMEQKQLLPMVAMRGLVGFPFTVMNLEIARDLSKNAVDRAMKGDRLIFLAAQKDMRMERPTQDDIYEIGIIARIRHVLKLKGNVLRVLIEGVSRASMEVLVEEDCFMAGVSEIVEPDEAKSDVEKAFMRTLIATYEELGEVSGGKVMPETVIALREMKSPAKLADTIALNTISGFKEKQEILETVDVLDRMEKLIKFLNEEINIAKLSLDISQKTRTQIDKIQKEHYLREQMRAIQGALEEGEPKEAETFEQKIAALPLGDAVKEKLRRESVRLQNMSQQTPDYSVLRTYLEWVTTLPFGVYTQDNKDLALAEQILEKDHYGMKQVKERILEYLAVLHLKENLKGPILCLTGPPGVGKTSIAKSMAEALGRKFVRMSLGGMRDEAEIRGHRRTYVGAIPGRIVSNIKLAGTMNPVFLLDEIDKIAGDFRGDPASALLEVLDPEINNAFQDHYLDIDFDLSSVLFVTTANDIDAIPRPLYDRMEIIEISGYTLFEKTQIAKRHLIPKLLRQHGLTDAIVKIDDVAIEEVITGYTAESGVRSLERTLSKIMRKAAKEYLGGKKRIFVRKKSVYKYLGTARFEDSKLPKEPMVGVSVGLAWTSIGGVTMPVEVVPMRGSGNLELTGQLGDVMKESAKAGISYIRAHAQQLGVKKDFHENTDLHIHVPEGAVPKDGPSAGITIATAVVSALTEKPVRNDIAMTGEITLTGRVLPIGGLKEKTLAAVRAGIHRVIIPADNEKNLEDIPQEIKKTVEFVPVETFEEVLKEALG